MNAVFWPMHQLGIEGMPRRYHTYSVDSWTELNSFISLSKIEATIKDFCLGRLPAIDITLFGEIMLILSPSSTSKMKLNSLPIEI